MISMGSLSRRPSTDWRAPLLISGAGLESQTEKPLDFHDYARKLRASGSNVLLTRPSRGSWRVSRHAFGRVVVQSDATGGASLVEGISQPGSFVFYLRDADCHGALSLNGQAFAANDVAVVPPGKQFAFMCRESHKLISLSVPVAALAASGFSALQLQTLGAGVALIPATYTAARQLSAAVMDALETEQDTSIARFKRCNDTERALLTSLVAALSDGDALNRASGSRTSRSLDRINRDALAFIRRHDGLDLHVDDLCRAINVAERSLLRAFHKFFGVGPTQYMKLRRLNKVHCELRSHDCKESSVTGIMTTCGVTEFGRFAGAYRALFGESPSETLKRRLETAVRTHLEPRDNSVRPNTQRLPTRSAA